MKAQEVFIWGHEDIVAQYPDADCGPYSYKVTMKDLSDIDGTVFSFDEPRLPLMLFT